MITFSRAELVALQEIEYYCLVQIKLSKMSITRRQDLREKQLLNELEPLLHQPVQTYRNGGTYVVGTGSKKIRLSSAGNHSATLAGRVYYEQLLSVKPPEQYSYNQSLEQDKFIRLQGRAHSSAAAWGRWGVQDSGSWG